MMMHW